MEEIVNEKVGADIKVKSLQNKLGYQKRKVQYSSNHFILNYLNPEDS